MPYQVSWQSVSMKSQTPVHVLGEDADGVADVLAGAALLAAGSAAHAPLAALAAARIVAANMPSLVMATPLPKHPDLENVSYKTQSVSDAAGRNIFDSSGRRATVRLRWHDGDFDLSHASREKRPRFLT